MKNITLFRFYIKDGLGQKISTLIDLEQGAGAYSITWDAKDDRGNKVTSGVYYYRLQAGKYVDIRKMLYLR